MAKVHQFPSEAKHRITHGEQTELHVCVKHLWFGVIPLSLLRTSIKCFVSVSDANLKRSMKRLVFHLQIICFFYLSYLKGDYAYIFH